jgi:hypothetical protein
MMRSKPMQESADVHVTIVRQFLTTCRCPDRAILSSLFKLPREVITERLLRLAEIRGAVPPPKRLKRFAKMDLMPGAEQHISFDLTLYDLTLIGQKNERVSESGTFDVQIGGLTQSFAWQSGLRKRRRIGMNAGALPHRAFSMKRGMYPDERP